jgi:hypothetical protein
MYSVVSFCTDAEKTEDFSRKLIDVDNQILWGLHIWQEIYEPSGFIDSVREDGDSLQHWHDALQEHSLSEVIEETEI